MFLHVLHPHHTITNLFLVPLNERESRGTAANGCCCTVIGVSRGTAANGCCCTVIGVGILSSPAESHPALVTQIPTCTVYGETPVRKLQLSRTAFRPHNLLFYNSNLSTLNPCYLTGNTLHVSTNSQHVSFIMLAKSDHVATVVASVNLLVGAASELRLHCHHQWNEGFECSLPQHSKLWENRPARFNQTWIELVLSK
jgi:hypothetical protein